MESRAPFHSKDEVVICFIKMDQGKTMNLVIIGLFEDYDINNVLPRIVNIPGLNGIINKGNSGFQEKGMYGCQL
jgi:hypothetical protein